MIKSILSMTMVFILALSITVSLSANQSSDTNDLISLNSEDSLYSNEFLSEEMQFSRLLELQEIASMYNDYGVVPYNIINFPEYMPNIVFLTAPSDIIYGEFYIGLYICHGDIDYDDRQGEEMTKIINTPVPTETVDFILDFAGIPYEDAKVFHSVYMETPLLPPGEPLPDDRVDPWEHYDTHIASEPYSSLNWTIRMGEEILIDGIGWATAGYTRNSNGTSFFTAPHSI